MTGMGLRCVLSGLVAMASMCAVGWAQEVVMTFQVTSGSGATQKTLTLVLKEEKDARLVDGVVHVAGGKLAVQFRGFYASGARTSSGQVMRFEFKDSLGNEGTADLAREEEAWSVDFEVTKVADPSSVSLYVDGPLEKR